jgi:hypothetical protein
MLLAKNNEFLVREGVGMPDLVLSLPVNKEK